MEKIAGRVQKCHFLHFSRYFGGFESTLHTLWAKGGCSAQALNYVAVPQQQSCKNNQGARGQKVPAGNGQKWRFLHFFANCWGFSRLQSPVGPGHCAHLPPMGLWCARGHAAMPTVGGGAAKMAGPGPKTAQNGPQMAVFAPKQPPMAGACGPMASFVLFVLARGGCAKVLFFCGGAWN